jgi:nicotinamidase-related amidase
MSRCAVLVIDMQRALFDAAPRPHEADVVIEKINALMARARAAGAPVVIVQHEDQGALAHGSQGWSLVRSLIVQPGDALVRKTTPDSFLNTPLADVLARHGATKVVVAGYASEFCVDTTVRRAAALGFGVVIAADAHTTHDKPHASGAQIRTHHNATLCDITSFGPKIAAVPSAEVQLGN